LQGELERAGQAMAEHLCRGQLAGEEHDAAARLLLGPIKGDVGVPQQFVDVATVLRGEGDADARADPKPALGQDDGLGQGGHETIRECPRGFRAVRVGLQNREFVAPEAADRRTRARGPHQSAGHRQQQPVADRVTEAVVDLLEPVEIEEMQRDPGARACECGGEQGPEPAPVGEPRERVVLGEMPQPLLGVPAIGDVERDVDRACEGTVGPQNGARRRDQVAATTVRPFDRALAEAPGVGRLDLRESGRQVGLRGGSAEGAGFDDAGQLARVPIHEEQPAVLVDRRHGDGQGVDEGAQAALRLAGDVRGSIGLPVGPSRLADRSDEQPNQQAAAQSCEAQAEEESATERPGQVVGGGGSGQKLLVALRDEIGERSLDRLELASQHAVSGVVAGLERGEGGFQLGQTPLHLEPERRGDRIGHDAGSVGLANEAPHREQKHVDAFEKALPIRLAACGVALQDREEAEEVGLGAAREPARAQDLGDAQGLFFPDPDRPEHEPREKAERGEHQHAEPAGSHLRPRPRLARPSADDQCP
jgi:hypothetical protein